MEVVLSVDRGCLQGRTGNSLRAWAALQELLLELVLSTDEGHLQSLLGSAMAPQGVARPFQLCAAQKAKRI